MSGNTTQGINCLQQYWGDKSKDMFIERDGNPRSCVIYRPEVCTIEIDPDYTTVTISSWDYTATCDHRDCKWFFNDGIRIEIPLREVDVSETSGECRYISRFHNTTMWNMVEGNIKEGSKLWYNTICSYLDKNREMFMDSLNTRNSFKAKDSRKCIRTKGLTILIDQW